MAANNCMQCDVAIVGSGFAGSLIANEFSQMGIGHYSGGRAGRSAEYQRLHEAILYHSRQGARERISAGSVRCPRKTGRWQADVADVGCFQLERSRTKLSRSEGAAALCQHLRAARRRYVALARHFAPTRAAGFHDEIEPWQERGRLSVPGLATRHHLSENESVLRQGGGRARRFSRYQGAKLSRYLFFGEPCLSDAEDSGVAARSTHRRCAREVDGRRDQISRNAATRHRDQGAKPAGRAQFPALPESPRLRRQYQWHSDLPDPGQI